MATGQEHVIALVTKLEDQASAGAERMATNFEKSAQRIASAEQSASAAVRELIETPLRQRELAPAGTGTHDLQIRQLEALRRAWELGATDIRRSIKRAGSVEELDAAIAKLRQFEAAVGRARQTAAGSAAGPIIAGSTVDLERQLARVRQLRAQIRSEFEAGGGTSLTLFRRIDAGKTIEELQTVGRAVDQHIGRIRTQAVQAQAASTRLTQGLQFFVGGIVGGAATAALFALQRQITELITGFAELAQKAEDLSNLKVRTGISVEGLQVLEFAAKQMNVSFESVRGASRRLAKQIEDDSPVFRALGIATRDASGALRSTEDVLLDLADAYHTSKDETSQLAVATKLGGAELAALVPILALGREGLKKFQDQARETGNIIDRENIAKLKDLDDTLDRLKAKWEGVVIRIKLEIAKGVAGALDPAFAKRQAELAAEQQRLFHQAATDLFGKPVAALNAEQIEQASKRANLQLKEMEERRARLAAGGREFGQDDLPLNFQESEKDRVAAALKRTEAEEKARAAAEQFDKQVAALIERLNSTDLGKSKVDALAMSLREGGQSLRTLLEQFKDAGVVEQIALRARTIGVAIATFGPLWKLATDAAGEHAEQVRSSEEKAKVLKDSLLQLLEPTGSVAEKTKTIMRQWELGIISVDEYFRKLREVEKEEDRRRGKPPVPPNLQPTEPVPTPPPPTALHEPVGVPADFFQFLLDEEAKATDSTERLKEAWNLVGQSVDNAVDQWAKKLVAFRGFFGDLLRDLVSMAIQAFAKMALIKLVELAINPASALKPAAATPLTGPPAPTGRALESLQMQESVPVSREAQTAAFDQAFAAEPSRGPGTQAVAASRFSRRSGDQVSRETSAPMIIIERLDAMDYGSVYDRLRSSFGSLQQARQAEYEAGLT
jgi:hypothetical protein